MSFGYKYSHDDPDSVVPQQYSPDRPTGRGAERDIGARLEKLRAIIRRRRG
jgi:putative ATPase